MSEGDWFQFSPNLQQPTPTIATLSRIPSLIDDRLRSAAFRCAPRLPDGLRSAAPRCALRLPDPTPAGWPSSSSSGGPRSRGCGGRRTRRAGRASPPPGSRFRAGGGCARRPRRGRGALGGEAEVLVALAVVDRRREPGVAHRLPLADLEAAGLEIAVVAPGRPSPRQVPGDAAAGG